MIKPIFISIVLLTLTATAFGQKESSSSKTLATLINTTSRIYDAGIRRDRATVNKYLASNFLETDATCRLRNKEWNLENLLGTEETLTYKIETPQVREYPGVAILFYIWNVDHGVNGKISNGRLRVTDTFIRTKYGWKLAASHRTKLNDKEDLEKQLSSGIRCSTEQ